MPTGLCEIADLLRAVEPEGGQSGCLLSCQQLLDPYKPSLVFLADAEGKVIAADDFGAATGPDMAARLAEDLVRRLAQSETCSWEVATNAGGQLACAVRLPGQGRSQILACLVPRRQTGESVGRVARPSLHSTRDAGSSTQPTEVCRTGENHLDHQVRPWLIVSGAFAWASMHNKAGNARLRRRIQHLRAEHETLKASHTEVSAAAIQEREERLRQQQEHAILEKLCQAAEAASRAKGEFLANASHELRTPLTAILGYTDLLLDPELSTGERHSHLQTIRRNGTMLLEIINDLLDLSKIEAGKMTVEPTECSPWQIVEDLVSLMRVRAVEEGLKLEADYVLPLPQTIHTDPVRLRQILMNLVGNALKFTEQGQVRITVRLSQADGSSPRLQFVVADTGIGIAAEEIGRLFQPFTQVDASATRRFGGTGLGLAISERLARMLGGQIEVQSELGKGSTFSLSIDPGPLDGELLLDTPSRNKPQPEQPPVVKGHRKLYGRVLLAEDGKDNQRLIRYILQKAGLEVELAENGRIACQQASASAAAGRPYDLILMDMQMPELDGYEATRRLRQEGWRGPIIALTAHAMSGDRQKCLDVGCDDYLSKPIQRDTFLATIEQRLVGGPGGTM